MQTETRRLSQSERDTLIAAEQILLGVFRGKNESMLLSLHHGWSGLSVCYFSPHKEQHGSIYPPVKNPTLADKIDEVFAIRAREDARPDHAKTARIEQLRKELSDLTGNPA